MKILKIEDKQTSAGKPYKRLTAEVDGKSIAGSYWGNQELAIGQEVELEVEEKNGFQNFKDKKTAYKGNREEKMKELQDIKQKNIKDAQYRKELSIAYFNSTNSAISLLAQTAGIQDRHKFIIEWRDWFLEEHKAYRLKELGNITSDSIQSVQITARQKLENCKSLADLSRVWSSLKPEEKPEVESLKNTLKTKLT